MPRQTGGTRLERCSAPSALGSAHKADISNIPGADLRLGRLSPCCRPLSGMRHLLMGLIGAHAPYLAPYFAINNCNITVGKDSRMEGNV